MTISQIRIQNFRKLKQCLITLTEKTTIFVGANNSGKTSAYQAISFFLKAKDEERHLSVKDFTLSHWKNIEDTIDKLWQDAMKEEKPIDEKYFLKKWREYSPAIDVWLNVAENEVQLINHILPSLSWTYKDKIGVRLIYEPKDLNELFINYKESFNRAKDKQKNAWPKSLHDFLNKELKNYFKINSYKIDPTFYNKNEIYELDDTNIKLDTFPLKEVIQVDIINAQRDISDSTQHGNKSSISKKLKHYYDNILNSSENASMTNEEKKALEEISRANNLLDEVLNNQFKSPLKKISNNINYPNFSNPSIRLLNNINPIDSLDKASNIQFNVFKNNDVDNLFLLPEYYNGLGYQNMLSLQIDLCYFADKRDKEETKKPIHLVLIEEPEVHLHVQMQETFVNQAYEVLNESNSGSTQLILSTHSSHIANTVEFSSLRYFKRADISDSEIPNSTVIDLSSSFKTKDKDNERFANRYLKLAHSDLFFTDGAILVEGLVEKLLLPTFVEKIASLNNRYITILEVGGAFAHVFIPLLKQLGIPILIITDFDKEDNESTGNPTIKEWYNTSDEVKKNINLVYQTEKDGLQPTTFEDALLLENIDFFINFKNHLGLSKKMCNLAKKYKDSKGSKQSIHDEIIKAIRNGKKSDLALDLLSRSEELIVPEYIKEGLTWLEKQLIGNKNE